MKPHFLGKQKHATGNKSNLNREKGETETRKDHM